MKLSKFAQQIESSGIKINFEYSPEYWIDYKDHFEDQETIDWIAERLDEGILAAWFQCSVSLSINGLTSKADYLGGCSYLSIDEFTEENNGYFDDMLSNCLEDLKGKIEEIKKLEINL